MRKILFAALAAMVMFASCDKDNNSEVLDGNQTLTVKLPSNVVTRGVEDAVAGNVSTTTVTNITAFLMNGTAVKEYREFDAIELAAKEARFEQISASIDKVVLVANYPTLTDFSTVTNLSGIKNFAFTITSQSAVGITDKTLYGESTAFVTAPDPEGHDADPDLMHTYKTTTIEVAAITARIEIGAVKAGKNIKSVELVGVWVNNYYEDGSRASTKLNNSLSTYWVTTPMATTSPSNTVFTPTIDNAYSPIEYFCAADNVNVKLDDDSKVYAFHVFSGCLPHIIMLVTGEYEPDAVEGENKYFMGWVTFNTYNAGAITAFEGNNIYKMGLGTTGVTIDAEDITDTPETTDFDLNATMTIKNWTEVNVTPSTN